MANSRITTYLRRLIMVLLFLIDAEHIYQFMLLTVDPRVANLPADFFGIPVPLFTRGRLDAVEYGLAFTSMMFFAGNAALQRMIRNYDSKLYWIVQVVAAIVSGVANAGARYFLSSTHILLILNDTFWTPIAMGMLVTLGLLIFAPMEAFELKQRIDRGRQTIARKSDDMTNQIRAVSKEEADFQRRLKHTPKQYRNKLIAERQAQPKPTVGPVMAGGRQQTYDPPGMSGTY
jgi:hypothetical protein